MKILVISQYYYPEPFKIHEICEELVKRGNEVTVITGRPNYPDGKLISGYEMYEIFNGVEVIRTNIVLRGSNPISLIRNYFSYPIKARKAIDKLEKEYDVVFVYQLSPVFMLKPALYYKSKYGKKVFVYCLDLWPESLKALRIKESNPIFKTMLNISNRLYNQCDYIMATSPSFLEYLKDTNKVDDNKLSVVYQHGEKMFLNVDRYKKQDKLNIMFAGNIGKVQDFDCLIKAIELLDAKYYSKLMITIIGSGSYLNEFKSKVERKEFEDVFIFTGRKKVEELSDYYNQASVFLLSLEKGSSISNTIPSKLQTYMAAGRGIIGSIDGPTGKIIKEAKVGITCGAGNYKKLSRIISDLIECDDLILENYSMNSRVYFLNNFTVEKYVDEISKIMKGVN